MMKKTLSILLALVMVLGLAVMKPASAAEAPEYTYHLSMAASPINWNPHAWEMSNESTLMGFIEMPLVDVSIAEDGVNFEWVFEGATDLEDVTATLEGREKWLTPDKDGNLPTEKLIYKISLNPTPSGPTARPSMRTPTSTPCSRCLTPP